MAVICFRGTKQVKDWMTNLKIRSIPISDPTTGAKIGNMHEGFHEAYLSVHHEIADRLQGFEDLPLYIPGIPSVGPWRLWPPGIKAPPASRPVTPTALPVSATRDR